MEHSNPARKLDFVTKLIRIESTNNARLRAIKTSEKKTSEEEEEVRPRGLNEKAFTLTGRFLSSASAMERPNAFREAFPGALSARLRERFKKRSKAKKETPKVW